MDDYQIKLENISKKIGILISRYNELKDNYQVLESENRQLKQQLKEEAEIKQELNNELNVVKISKQFATASEEEKNDVKKKINEFIKEIDKCVAMLND